MALCSKISFHPDPVKRTLITVIYCGTGIFFNFFMLQVFCRPVPYAAAMCIAFFLSILAFPFVNSGWLKLLLSFLLGTGVPICAYCILFLGDPRKNMANYIGFIFEILLFGLGLLAFIPFYLLWHIRKYYNSTPSAGKLLFMSGVFLPIVALIMYLFNLHAYQKLSEDIASKSANLDEYMARLPKNYFTERRLGLCWKYHTELEYVYDGWRPPLHDPFVVIGLWFYPLLGSSKPFPFQFEYNADAIKYYHRKFPERPLVEKCPCSYSGDGRTYPFGLDSVQHIH